jgi:hypothetical protein
MSVVGNQYIDTFLTAGLGCHRVHHVLPSQRSGFANIVSEHAVKEVCKEYKMPWGPTKNFILHRLPGLFSFYMFAPGRLPGGEVPGFAGVLKEAFSKDALISVVSFIWYGFIGVGSI